MIDFTEARRFDLRFQAQISKVEVVVDLLELKTNSIICSVQSGEKLAGLNFVEKMKPEGSTPCSLLVEDGLNVTRTRHAIRRTNVGLKCSSCQRRFPSAARLRRHLSVVHKNSGRIFCCNKCNIAFDDLSVFLQHSKSHRAGHKHQHEEEQWHQNFAAEDHLGASKQPNVDVNGHDLHSRNLNEQTDDGLMLETNGVASSTGTRQGINQIRPILFSLHLLLFFTR